MKGELAQAVALACHGNAFLQDKWSGSFFSSNSTCAHCEWVRFVRPHRRMILGTKEIEVARAPVEWFRWLTKTKAVRIGLLPAPSASGGLPDRIAAAFAGSSDWLLGVLREDGTTSLWECRWEIGNRDASTSRIWRVTYGEVCEAPNSGQRDGSVETASDGLREALKEILLFANQEANGAFSEFFEKALAILSQTATERGRYHPDLAPDGVLSRKAANLLSACQTAWVFGGMGSWNDLLFEGEVQEEYVRVSEQLYGALMTAIRTAANASARPETATSK